MTESRDARVHIERLIERAQSEIIDASRQLTEGITRGTDRFVPPISADVQKLVDDVFDFAERVIKGQRTMVSGIVKTINDESDKAAQAGRQATARLRPAATQKKAPARKKAPAKKKAPANKTAAAKKAPAGGAPAKKASASR